MNKCTGVTGVVQVTAESEGGPETFFGTGKVIRSSEYKRVQVRMNDVTHII